MSGGTSPEDVRRPGLRRLLPPPYVPLAAVLTVTLLVAQNPDAGIVPGNLPGPLGLALLVALVGWLAAGRVTRSRGRRGPVAVVVTLVLLTSGYAFGWLRRASLPGPLAEGIELILALGVIAGAVVLVRRLPPATESVSRFLTLTTALLLLFTLPALLGAFRRSDDAPSDVRRETAMRAAGPRPDIYLVVLDAYSGPESLREVYGFDNGAVLDSLRLRGFRIPRGAKSNYTKTFLSVGSMLNRDYYRDGAAGRAPASDRRPAYRTLEFNRTVLDLRALGYEFLYIGSSYPPMARNRLADEQYPDVRSREFEAVWLRLTVLAPVLRLVCGVAGCGESELPFVPETASETDARLRFLRQAVGRPGPTFVLAHLLLPHGPFRYGPGCAHRPARWTAGEAASDSDSLERRLYVDQVRCTNRKLLEFVDAVREAEPGAVVLLQADHGYARFPGGRPGPLEQAADDQVRERFDVFAAYAGPGSLADSLAATRTPVNLLRTLFRVLWDFDEPPLPDRFYWSDTETALATREVFPE